MAFGATIQSIELLRSVRTETGKVGYPPLSGCLSVLCVAALVRVSFECPVCCCAGSRVL